VRVVALRQRLAAEGFLSPASNQGELFDAEVEAAVKQFQDHHYLTADGVVGRGTLAALNVPIESRIDQLRVNLERGRWVLHDLESRFIIVDIAGFEAFYYNNDEDVWTTRVQVGKPYRATPVFRDQITYLDFNPTWTIPPTILAKDILPKVKRDVSYLSERNIKVLDRNGTVIDPHTLDWSKYSGRNFPYILRQDPGPNNALGRVKFMFPNPHFVYLHDTPSKSLFNRTGRAFSSGCIRVEKPVELAEILLNDPKRWNQEKIRREFETAKTRSVRLKEPVPILLFYWTARPDDNGHVRFKQDIYGRDTAVLRALNDDFKVHSRHARATK
jgi:murein L,D-transpeptidase YcbB/YkuD